MPNLLRHCLHLGVMTLALACASSGGTREAREGSDRLVLAPDDSRIQMGGTVLDLIRRERPQWLSRRTNPTGPGSQSAGIVVYRDGVRLGGVDTLREMPVHVVESARFLSGPEASSRFGLNHQFGAILLVTRK
ncbi:MAG TPA: hypothetical protein VMM18_03685 [Gemmatimonadaceae bacterium]|nr:hypothetical protein [Gemmatimonadaceae bacterium]